MRMNSGKETSFFDRARWVHEYAPGSYTMLYDSEVETYLTEFQKKQEDFHISTVLSGESYALDGHLLLVNVSSTMRTRIYTAPV